MPEIGKTIIIVSMIDFSRLAEDGGQRPVILLDGSQVNSQGCVVVMGPNGSGKTRLSRQLRTDPVGLEVVNALRNTRINPQLQPLQKIQADAQLAQAKVSAAGQPFEMASDFDLLLTSLITGSANASMSFMARARAGDLSLPELSALEEIQQIWSEFFPGRSITFDDYTPMVENLNVPGGQPQTYSALTMSDGEKAALNLAGRLLSAEYRAVVLVVEPETHFHSLLAVRFWDAIEKARPDLRLIYVTHDIHFASTRRAASFLIASPEGGLIATDVGSIPDDVTALILGSATLSFVASKIVFCEGDDKSFDRQFYSAWFDSRDVVVQPVGSCEMVQRCVSTMQSSGIARNLVATGLIDRDFHPQAFIDALGSSVKPLGLHEIESLFAVPGVVAAVADYLKRAVPLEANFLAKLRSSFSQDEIDRVILERWKRRVEGQVVKVVASVSAKSSPLSNIVASIPTTFDQKSWTFSPEQILHEEEALVLSAMSGSASDLLEIMPAKGLLGVAANAVGMTREAYADLVIASIGASDPESMKLRTAIRAALSSFIAVPE